MTNSSSHIQKVLFFGRYRAITLVASISLRIFLLLDCIYCMYRRKREGISYASKGTNAVSRKSDHFTIESLGYCSIPSSHSYFRYDRFIPVEDKDKVEKIQIGKKHRIQRILIFNNLYFFILYFNRTIGRSHRSQVKEISFKSLEISEKIRMCIRKQRILI